MLDLNRRFSSKEDARRYLKEQGLWPVHHQTTEVWKSTQHPTLYGIRPAELESWRIGVVE